MSTPAQNPSIEHPEAHTPLLHTYPPLLKNRNFLLLWLAYVISALGDRIHFVVMLALLAAMKHIDKPGTQETAQLNVMMLLPFLFIGPFSGVIADRLPRRLVMVVSDFTRMGIVIAARTMFLAIPKDSSLHNSVSWMPWISYAILLLLVSELLVGVFSAFFSPARTALMPNLVHPDQLLRANSLTNSAGTIASLLGFLLGAQLIKAMNVALYVDAATFLASGALLMMMRGKTVEHRALPVTKRRLMLAEFAEGLKYIRQHQRVMQIIGLMFLFWCCGAIILSGLTGVVTHTFGMDESAFANSLGIVGIGMMAGAASCSLARHGIAKEFGIAWCMLLVGVFFYLFSLPQQWWLALSLLVVCAFFGAILLVTLDTLLQRIVPDYIRGRVMSVRDMIANVGLVGVAVPLAISPAIDNYIILILRIVAGVVMVCGALLIIYYYRRQPFTVPAAICRRIVVAYLSIFKKFDIGNAMRIPSTGPVIFVANHTTAYDPLCLQAASKHRLIQFMMAKEYYRKKPFYWLYKFLKVIPVNRTGNDTASIRTALRALQDNACIGMFPEGKISDDGRMNEGREGVALLALMSGATVVPAYIQGTNAYSGMVSDFLQRGHVTLYCGAPLRFDDLKGKPKEEARKIATQRIMDAIIALRERYETNPERRVSSAQWAAEHGTAITAPSAPAAS